VRDARRRRSGDAPCAVTWHDRFRVDGACSSVPTSTQVVVSPEREAVTIAYHLLGPTGTGTFGDITRNLGFEGIRVARDPEDAIAELTGKIRTLILVTDEASEHVAVLSMPQMCILRERFTAHPRGLVVRVLERDCAIH